jgi:hypothetical protein
MLVRMLIHVSGGRNGVPWPRAGTTIDLPEDEAMGLIRSDIAAPEGEDARNVVGIAAEQPVAGHPSKVDLRVEAAGVPVEGGTADAVVTVQEAEPAPAEAAEPAGEPSAAPDVAAPGVPGVPDLDGGSLSGAQPAVPEAAAPGPSAPKQAWIDFAIGQGADPATAGAMTKADLMSRYGGRL